MVIEKISRATHMVVVIKTKKHLEEQENLVSIKDQIVAAIGHLSLTVHLWILDIHSKITVKNSTIRNEMLKN